MPSQRDTVEPYHRNTGDALGYAADVEIVRMRCKCGVLQEEPCDADASMKKVLAETTCMFCGALGQMTKEK
jgi:hypothetical protein